MVTIREAGDEDVIRISALWGQFMAYNAAFNDSFNVRKQAASIFAREMTERKQNPDCRLAVAEFDGDLIGFCYSYISLKPKYFKLGRFGFIGDLYVKPKHRGQGIGRRLVDDAMNFFNKRKIKQIELLVAVENTDTIKFWKALGFDHLLTWMYKRT